MRRFLTIAVLVALLAASGCGGGSDDESGGSDLPVAAPGVGDAPPGSKKAYIAQADVTCSELNAKLQKLGQPKSPKDIGELYRKIAAEAEEFYDKFQAIPKPERGRQVLETYQVNLRKNIALTEQVATVVENNETRKLAPLIKRVQRVQERNHRIAERYGFQICGGTLPDR
jgi:hypothetical protein